MQELLELSKQLLRLRIFKSVLSVESSLLSYYKSEVDLHLTNGNKALISKLKEKEDCLRLMIYNVDITIKLKK